MVTLTAGCPFWFGRDVAIYATAFRAYRSANFAHSNRRIGLTLSDGR
jgi:hypothetical protein